MSSVWGMLAGTRDSLSNWERSQIYVHKILGLGLAWRDLAHWWELKPPGGNEAVSVPRIKNLGGSHAHGWGELRLWKWHPTKSNLQTQHNPHQNPNTILYWNRKPIWKFTWQHKRPRIGRVIPSKNTTWHIAIPHPKVCYTTIVITMSDK